MECQLGVSDIADRYERPQVIWACSTNKANFTYFFLSAKFGRKYANLNTDGQRLFTLGLMEQIPLELVLTLLLVIPQPRLVESSSFGSIPLSPLPAQTALLHNPAPSFKTSKYHIPFLSRLSHIAHQQISAPQSSQTCFFFSKQAVR